MGFTSDSRARNPSNFRPNRSDIHGVMTILVRALDSLQQVDDCKNKRQGLTFAGVNAHHQNGIAERRIRSLQELARAMMIHAKHRWPKAVEANLWPCAVRMASNIMNETPNLQHEKKLSPSQVFTNTNVNINPKHIKPFGCPVYVLDNALQQGNIHHKWKERSRSRIVPWSIPKTWQAMWDWH